MSVFFRKEAMS